MFTSLHTICFDNFTAPFDPNAINQNFGSGGFGGDGFGGGGFGVSASASHSNFDPNALNHGFGGGGFGNYLSYLSIQQSAFNIIYSSF